MISNPLLSPLPPLPTTTLPVFDKGPFNTTSITVDTSNPCAPPKELLIVAPTDPGTYPVILFYHGFYLRNVFYTELFHHISSYGYVVVAPQLYDYIVPSGKEQVKCAAEVASWLVLHTGLQTVLPPGVQGDLERIVIAGHSEGGKIAFAVALGCAECPLRVKFSALVGVDPVAGISKGCQCAPKILTYIPQSFSLSMPVTVIGSGLGNEGKCCKNLMPCAPNGVNHVEFFNECKPPCAHFVVADYGHMDMLDDNLAGWKGSMANCICKNGKGPRILMRRTVGGIFVAFLKAFLAGDRGFFKNIIEDPSVAPAKLEPVKFIDVERFELS